jgi:hypothetical protein
MNRERPKTGITVAVPDLSVPLQQALLDYNRSRCSRPAEAMDPIETGYVQTERGLFALNTEGVGPAGPITAKSPLEVKFYAEGEGWSPAVPTGAIVLDDKELLAFPVDKRVPLERFIRQFSNRLEMNFGDWYLQLKQAKPVGEAVTL